MSSRTKIFMISTLAVVLTTAVFLSVSADKDPVKVSKEKTECCKFKTDHSNDIQTTAAAKNHDCVHKEYRCCGSATPCSKSESDKCCKISEKSTQKADAESCCKKK